MPKQVSSIAVIGAGVMGRGIAVVAALGGFRVAVQDVSREALADATESVSGMLKKAVDGNKMTRAQANEALERITFETMLDAAVHGSELVIEVVPEDLQTKAAVLDELDRLSGPGVILASNTSSMSITELAALTERPDRFVGMHFFNPVHAMRLVEVIAGLETSEETVLTVEQVAHGMGKETVRVKDIPGFAVTRISALIGNEAFRMLMEGVATAHDIDRAVRLGLGHPMGPLEVADLVGLDTRLKVLEYLHRTLGERFRPCPLLVQYVKAARLGRKTGRGVYSYR